MNGLSEAENAVCRKYMRLVFLLNLLQGKPYEIHTLC